MPQGAAGLFLLNPSCRFASMQRHVKIVLPCANEGEWLRVTVDSILEHTRAYPSFEVAVLANGDTETDFSFADREPYRELVRISRSPSPLGVGRSINAALSPGDATFYVFLDAHCLLEQDDWLERGIRCLEGHPTCSMAQPEVVEFVYRGELGPRFGTPDPDLIERVGLAYAVRWAWPYESPSYTADYQIRKHSELPYEGMGGGGMAVFAFADTFHALGRYDPEVPGWYPETLDYCIRGWMRGHPMIVEPRVTVLHRRKTESPGYDRRHVDLIHGTLRTAWKYLSPRRRDLAESLYRHHGLHAEVDEALRRIRAGKWLEERVEHLSKAIQTDDWLFEKFGVPERRFGLSTP